MRQHDTRRKSVSSNTSRAAQPTHASPLNTLFAPQGQTLTHPDTMFALQRTIGNAGVRRLLRNNTLQRDPADTMSDDDEISMAELTEGTKLEGVESYVDAASFIAEPAIQLLEYKTFFTNTGKKPPDELLTTFNDAKRLIALFNSKEGEVSVDDISTLHDWYTAYEDAEYIARDRQAGILQDDLDEKLKAARKIEEEFLKMEPALRELQNQAFTTKDPDKLVVIGDAISNLLGTAETIKTMALRLETAYDQVRMWRKSSTLTMEMSELTKPGVKLFEAIGNIQAAYSQFKDLKEAIDLLAPKKTTKEEAMSWLTIIAKVSDMGIGFGDKEIMKTNLPLTGYPIGPMVENALKISSQINSLRAENQMKGAFSLEWYEHVDWDLMPGNWDMFDFMKKLMHASSAKDVPDLPSSVSSYFVDHANNFNAALGQRADVPVQGLFSFTMDINMEKVKPWAFKHRNDLWGALYGTAPVPRY